MRRCALTAHVLQPCIDTVLERGVSFDNAKRSKSPSRNPWIREGACLLASRIDDIE
jgi:hypothetical protein